MRFEITGSDGRPVRAVAHGEASAPTVLVAHGFKGFKDWGFFPWICDQIAAAGLRAVRFDYSHNGVEETDFDRLDLFLLDTPTRHQEDLRALAEATSGPLGLLGHSRGGGDAILFAAGEPRVKIVTTLASVSTTVVDVPDLETHLRGSGTYPFPNARTGQIMPVGRHAFEDGARHSLEGAARALTCPLVTAHGTDDEAVPAKAQTLLCGWAPQAEAITIPGTGHTFGTGHPFTGPTEALRAAVEPLVARLSEALLPE